jgi:hypothetical protein
VAKGVVSVSVFSRQLESATEKPSATSYLLIHMFVVAEDGIQGFVSVQAYSTIEQYLQLSFLKPYFWMGGGRFLFIYFFKRDQNFLSNIILPRYSEKY